MLFRSHHDDIDWAEQLHTHRKIVILPDLISRETRYETRSLLSLAQRIDVFKETGRLSSGVIYVQNAFLARQKAVDHIRLSNLALAEDRRSGLYPVGPCHPLEQNSVSDKSLACPSSLRALKGLVFGPKEDQMEIIMCAFKSWTSSIILFGSRYS